MSNKEQECPYCGRSRPVIKSGFNPTGSHRYRYKCRSCVRYFTPKPKPMGYEQERRGQALQIYLEGMSLRAYEPTSLRAIGRTLHIHHQSVANWIKAHEANLRAQVQDTTPTKTVEVDELFTYIGKIGKKTGAST